MPYKLKEIYYTLQGEGAQTGHPAVFVRFTGCNLWSGHEKNRAEAACYFCDTDFVGTDGENGGNYKTEKELAEKINSLWPSNHQSSKSKKLAVFTGGEPLLQLDTSLIKAVQKLGFQVAVETNGTIKAPEGIDWLTVSPKPNSSLIQKSGSELKLVYPHEVKPESLSELDFKHFYLMPLDSPSKEESKKNLDKAVAYCLDNPRWKLTLQTHKILNIK